MLPFIKSHAGCIFYELRAIGKGKTKMVGNICKGYGINMLLYIIQHHKVLQTAGMTGGVGRFHGILKSAHHVCAEISHHSNENLIGKNIMM